MSERRGETKQCFRELSCCKLNNLGRSNFPRFSRKALLRGGMYRPRCAGLAWAPEPVLPPAPHQNVAALRRAARPRAIVAPSRTVFERRVFCPFVRRDSPLDAHERKPRGADAAGDVVSAEPLQRATTLFLDRSGPSKRGLRRSRGVRATPVAHPPRKRFELVRLERISKEKLPG